MKLEHVFLFEHGRLYILEFIICKFFNEFYFYNLYCNVLVGLFFIGWTKLANVLLDHAVLTHCSHFIPPENTREPLVFWYFQGV